MARHIEDFGRRKKEEEERKRRLSGFSRVLSHRILTNEGQQPLAQDIPEETLIAFQTGSIAERDAYWKGKGNFGQKMTNWLGLNIDGKPGIKQWVEKQTDPDVIRMLQAVGLQNSPKQREESLNDPHVIALMNAITNDFPPESHSELRDHFQNETTADSLIFYSRYLNQKKGSPTDSYRSLINTLFEEASRESNGDNDEIIKKLEKVSPLLAAAGEEGQDVLGALLVAKTHGSKPESFATVNPDSDLNPAEKKVMDYMKKYANPETPEEQKAETPERKAVFNVEEEFGALEPEPTPGHEYFVNQPIPPDFAAKLTPEQLKQLELRKSFFVLEPDGSGFFPNSEVFPQARVLEHDERFVNAEALTNNDSGLFALAAASAESSEQQAALYKTLGETVLRVHQANPELLKDFLNAQSQESQYEFIANDLDRAEPLAQEKRKEILQVIEEAYKEKFKKPISLPSIPEKLKGDEEMFIQDKFNELGPVLGSFNESLLRDISTFPDRLLSLREIPVTDPNRLGQADYQIDIMQTKAAWPERVKALQEALSSDPLTLSVDQIRQIEFLAHSVDTVQIIHWLQGESTLSIPAVPVGPKGPPIQAAETMEQAVEYQVSQENPITLTQLFTRYDKVSEAMQQRNFAVDTTHLAVFSTLNEDPLHFSFTNERGAVSFYSDKKDAQGRLLPNSPTDLLFLTPLLQEGSLSGLAFRDLQEKYGQPLLIAYSLEAAQTPQEQTVLFKNLFLQVARIYTEHPHFREEVETYLRTLPQDVSPWKTEDITRLFGSEEATAQRLTKLSAALALDTPLTLDEIRDMNLYAVPFNLENLARRMRTEYGMRQAALQNS